MLIFKENGSITMMSVLTCPTLIFKENGSITMMSVLTGPTLSSQDGMRRPIQHMV